MLLAIKEDLTQAKDKARTVINDKIDKMSTDILTKTHFVNEVHRLKRDEINRYNKEKFNKNPDDFPFIKMEMELTNCSLDESVDKIKAGIETSENAYINLERIRKQSLIELQAAQSIPEIRSIIDFFNKD